MNGTQPYRLAEGVTVRTERFGGLLYHHRTRRLYFLRSPLAVALIRELDGRRALDDVVEGFRQERALPPDAIGTLMRALADVERLQLITHEG
jgi:putative mycofactocin binding protein MftB